MVNQVFVEISLLIAIVAIVSVFMRVLRQPLIIGYILTGIFVGPAVLNLINDPHTIETLGKFGIVLLLFIVGLGLNPKTIKELGRASFITGIGEVLIATFIGFLIVRAFGFDVVSSIYIALGLALSSTIVILKLLSDKKEQNRLHGRITIGFLLVQDIIATIALLVSAASANGGLEPLDITLLIGKGLLLSAAVYLASSYLIKPLGSFFSRSQELLFLFAIAWGLGIAALFFQLGFSLEVGALFAGVLLASMSYAQDIASRLRPLRDFFIVIFFVSLGASMEINFLGSLWWQAIALSLFVLVGNPIIVMSILGLLGYKKHTSFKTAIAIGQVSEFSLIFVLLGASNNQLTHSGVALVTIVALITFALSSYQIIYSDKLYKYFEKYLTIFEKNKTNPEHNAGEHYEGIIFGYKKGGKEFARSFSKLHIKYLIVDHDPDVIDEISMSGYDYLYGDATNLDLLEDTDIDRLKSVVSTITDKNTTEFIVRHVLDLNPKILVICSADSASSAARLYEMGATYVMMPHTIGTEKISNFITHHGLKKSEFKAFRDKHIVYISNSIHEPLKLKHQRFGRIVIDKMSVLTNRSKK